MSAMFDVWASPDYPQTLVSLGISPGSARSVAAMWPNPASLATATVAQLRRHGLTPGQARRLIAAMDLAKLANRRPTGPGIRGPDDAFNAVAPALAVAEHEILVVVMLDGHQQVIDVSAVSQGSPHTVRVTPGDVFRLPIRAAATSILLAHNHPSGDPEPSDSDLEMTDRVKETGRVVGIPLIDHLIIARGGGYRSLADLGFI